jgi:hypothetical protein
MFETTRDRSLVAGACVAWLSGRPAQKHKGANEQEDKRDQIGRHNDGPDDRLSHGLHSRSRLLGGCFAE